MKLDGRHLRSEKLLQYYLALSILRKEALMVMHPTSDMKELIDDVAACVQGSVQGREECIFIPQKLGKKIQLNLQGRSLVTLLQTLLIPILFCGHQVTIVASQSQEKELSTYYLRDVLFAYLHRYLSIAKLSKDAEDEITLVMKGMYSLDQAPPFILRENKYLVALRGEVQVRDESMADYIELSLKEFGVPVRLHRTISSTEELIHLDALYGTHEGYDNDFAYILPIDIHNQKELKPLLESFKESVRQALLPQGLIEDLLLLVGLLGGQLPFDYEETDFMLDILNDELEGVIEKRDTKGYQWSHET